MLRLIEQNYAGYDFYYQGACGEDPAIYNIVPTGSKMPLSGYCNMQWIESIRGIRFPDRYQATKNGMRNLYKKGTLK